MYRRNVIKAISALCVSNFGLQSSKAIALLNCSPPDMMGLQLCEAGISSDLSEVTAVSQRQTQWCWAACIETVFRYYQHPLPQEEIVRQTWGDVLNMPANPTQIIEALNRSWLDDNGRRFRVHADTYSVNAMTAAQDLAADMPLIIGTLGHAMVLSSLQYVRDFHGRGNVNFATVRDPWGERGRRNLTPQEWYSIDLAARIRVS